MEKFKDSFSYQLKRFYLISCEWDIQTQVEHTKHTEITTRKLSMGPTLGTNV